MIFCNCVNFRMSYCQDVYRFKVEDLKKSISVVEQRISLKFCAILNYSGGVAHDMLVKSVSRNALNKRTVQRWLEMYKQGRITAQDEPRAPRPISSTRVLTEDLGLVNKLAVWVPHSLNTDQKGFRYKTARSHLTWYHRKENILYRFICIEESWVEFYTPHQPHQSRSWVESNTSAEPLPRAELHDRKIRLIVAMDIRGIAFWRTYDENITMTGERYKSFLEENIAIWALQHDVSNPIILHDNTRPYKSKIVQQLIEDKAWIEIIQPPYSPDMNPCDFNCFGHVKRKLSGTRCSSLKELDIKLNNIICELNGSGTLNGVQDCQQSGSA
ncbi:histone-lysine N-methyltransferase SETMAR-like [Cephus cinctus]|uniref:Histone-lysine N-methyltransferase SETMAR-like n=1 Tax=Cephus cinctus TaxID=211228 RepID=A0AAJ7CA40_CEPCN|nr:histone-lysine N-methyltransferase SETMAR-like [Cephus cinctus]